MNNTSIPKEAISIYNNAFEIAASGNILLAIEQYKKAIELCPNFIEARNNMGELYSQLGDSNRAIETYQDALKFSGNHKLFFNLGLEFYKAERYDEALGYFLEAVSKENDFAEANYYAGLIFYTRENYTSAEYHLSAVVRSDPKHLKTNYMLSYIYYINKQYGKAVECLDRIKDIADDTLFINKYYGFCHYHLGNYALSIEYLTTVLESRPEYAKFRDYLKGLTYENKIQEIGGDINNAIKDMETKMTEMEQSLSEASRLSMLYIFKGENHKAEKMLLKYKAKRAS